MKGFCCLLILFIITPFNSAAAGQKESKHPEQDRRLVIFVSILPQKYLVERIGTDKVHVEMLVKPGESPHSFEPTPKHIMAIGKADAYFTLGFPFEEKLMEKISSAAPHCKIFSMDEGIERRPIDEHNPGKDEHEEGDSDPHIWLAPKNIMILAVNIHRSLLNLDPVNADSYTRELGSLNTKLKEVDSRIGQILAPYRGGTVFVFHPAFGYFTDAYGLKQYPVETEGKSPTPRQLEALIKKARELNAKIIFVQPQFDRRSAEIVAESIGGVVVPIDPLSADLIDNLKEIADRMEESLRSGY